MKQFLFIIFLFVVNYSFSQITINYTETESRCQSSGSLTITASGGNAPYLYEITAGPTTRGQQVPNVFNALPSGTYTVRVVDNLGFSNTTSASVSGNYTPPVLSVTGTQESCYGNDAKIFIGVSGGRPPYTYRLIAPSPITAGPQAIDSFTNLVAGNYTVRVDDSCGNFSTQVYTVNAIDYSSKPVIWMQTIDFDCDSTTARFYLRSLNSGFTGPVRFLALDWLDNTDTLIDKTAVLPDDTIRFERYRRYLIKYIDGCGNEASVGITGTGSYSYGFNAGGYSNLGPDCVTGLYSVRISGTYVTDSNLSMQILTGPVIPPIQYNSNNIFDSLTVGSYTYRVCDTLCDTCANSSFTIVAPVYEGASMINWNACDTGNGQLRITYSSNINTPIVTFFNAPPTLRYPLPYTDTIAGSQRYLYFYDFPKGYYEAEVKNDCGFLDTVRFDVQERAVYFTSQLSSSIQCNNTFTISTSGFISIAGNPTTYPVDLLDSNGNLLESATPLPTMSGADTNSFYREFDNLSAGKYIVRYYIYSGSSICPSRYKYDTIIASGTYSPPVIDDAISYICKDSTFGQTTIIASGGLKPYSYEIISGPIIVPPQSDSNFYNLPTGVYQIRLADSCGNSSILATEITQYGVGNISYSNPTCIGSNYTAIADTLPGATYQWTGPNAYLSNTRTLNLTPLSINDTGVYYLNVSFGTCIDTIIAFPVYGDTFPPVANCKDTTIYLSAAGTISIDSSFVDNGSFDNCGVINFQLSKTNFNCSDIGINNVSVIVRDLLGNSDTCYANVTVIDTVNPNPICQNRTIYLDASGNASITPAQINNGSTDNCAIASYSLSQTAFNCSNVGANSVTLYVTDVNSNVDSCSATVTVIDTVNPNPICQNRTIYLDASGNASITPAQINNGSTDNCAIASYSLSQTAFNCSDIGGNSVTLYVTDVNSNIDSCLATVTILDTFSITPSCKDTTVYLNAGGNVTIDSSYVITAGTGCSAITSATISQNSFNCSNVGNNVVNVSINGTISCTSNVIVSDTVNPNPICQNRTIYVDASGNASITPVQINNGSTDNCAIASYSLSQTAFNCSNVGANSVTLYVTDVNSNVDSCSATVTVIDTVNPNPICQNISVYLDASGNASITPAQINNGSTDNCAIASYSLSQTAFNCSNVGANSVTLYVTDVNSNIDSCLATVTILDTFSITPSCKDTTVYLNAGGNVTIDSSFVITTGTGCSAITSATISQNSFNCSNVGNNVVNVLINGTISCTSNVIVSDTINPNPICQNISVYLDGSGNASITPAQINNGSTDNCAIASYSLSQTAFNCSNVGANSVTLYVTDVNSNVDSCSATVTVIDTINPNPICQNISVYLDGSGNASITPAQINNGSTDNCAIASYSLSQTAFTCSNVGANSVTLYVTDVNSNVDSCSATVTVIDTINPNPICQNISVYLDASGNASITPAQINNGSTDNCAIASYSLSQTAFTCSNVGANSVTLYVTDVNSNVDSCSATVTVIDTINPNPICQNISVYLDGSGNASITPAQINNGSTDNCAIASYSLSQTAFTCSNVGANSVTLYVTDVNSNVDSCSATVTVIDTINPNPICQNISVYLDGSGNASITPAQINNGSTDNCAIASYSLSQTAFNCSNVGANSITLYVTDVNSNVDSCIATVTVLDSFNIVPTCKDTTVYLSGGGNVIIDSSYVITQGGGCSAVTSAVISQNSFNCFNVGNNVINVTINGSISCTANVIVSDTINPNPICQNISVYLDGSGNASITPAQINNGSTDNCAIASYSLSQTVFTCSNVGANSVTLYVTDVNSNMDSCSATVTVIDTINPNPICQNISVYIDASGNASITPAQINNGSTDNCAIASYSLSQTAFNCSNVGANSVTLYVTDVNSNVDSCSATVTVIDTVNPNPICQNISVYLDASGNVTITPVQINNGSTDNCAIASYSLSQTDFTCSNVGANLVTLYVTDVNSNVDSCSATVTVIDTVNPNPICQNRTIYLDASGNASITPAQINNGSTDNCAIASYSLSQTAFNCSNVGANSVTLYVTDVNSNVDSCSATVTVIDTINPNPICQNISVYLDGSGNASITPAQINNGSTDNCAIASYSLSQTAFNCSNVGANSVTLYVTDVNSNMDSCSATVTVIDTINPNPICQNISVYLDASGNANITPAQINNGSTDNCAIASYSLSQTVFTCSNVGVNSVTLYVTDVNSNVDSCSATVTVIDTINPNPICQNISVYLDASGNVTITPAQINNGSTDNCAIASYSLSQTAFNCSNVGANSVTLYVTDVNSNVDSCSTTVTVIDTVNPTPVCKDSTVYLDAAGNITIDSSFIDNGSYDNCGITSITVTPNSFNCSNVGINSVILSVTDINGNNSTCMANLTVLDTTSPTASCNDITVYLDSTGIVILDSNAIDNGSYDNCAIQYMSITPNTFNCNDIGINTVTLTVYDVNGNYSSCQANVNVLDDIAPTIICPSDIVDTVVGVCEFEIPDYIANIYSNDNCDSANIIYTQTPASGTIVPINYDGSITNTLVTITATDLSNNTNLCSFNVDISCVPELNIPQFFSPNGDGKNDTWHIVGIEAFTKSDVKIFNRYGSLVYSKINYDNSWDGKVNSSIVLRSATSDEVVPAGTYFYVVKVTYLDEETTYTGFVHLEK